MAAASLRWMFAGALALSACAAVRGRTSDARPAPTIDAGVIASRVCDHDGGVASIDSNDYDRSCKVDSDCVAVAEGNVCEECLLFCKTGVVSKADAHQYGMDLAQLVRPLDPDALCFCPATWACCIDGRCSAAPACGDPERNTTR